VADDLFQSITEHLKNPQPSFEGNLLTEEELDLAIISFLEGRGEGGATEEEIVRFVKWLEMARLNNSLVDLFFKGLVQIDDPTGEFKVIEDDNLVVRATELGKKVRNELH